MLAPLWLAVAGLPVFNQPFPDAPEQPAAIALAANEVSLRRPCLQLDCRDGGWRAGGGPGAVATTYPADRDGEPRVIRTPLPGATLPGVRRLPAPGLRRDWVEPYAGLDRVSARYGRTLVDTARTDVDVELGTGFRWQPYVDNGSADTGMVARGSVALRKKLGERTEVTQTTRVEAGRDNTFLRNSLGVQVDLMPNWSLNSDVEVRHDTAANGGSGQTQTEGNVQLQYSF